MNKKKRSLNIRVLNLKLFKNLLTPSVLEMYMNIYLCIQNI